MTQLRQRMIECLQLRGLSESTQESYVQSVSQLAEHYRRRVFGLRLTDLCQPSTVFLTTLRQFWKIR